MLGADPARDLTRITNMPDTAEYSFGQIHIDGARNSTDDFNPFHDPNRFDRILRNPYPLPIVLGFQLECLCGYLVERLRPAGERHAALLCGHARYFR